MCPEYRLDEFLPVTTTREEEHEGECPNEVGSKEGKTIRSKWATVRLNYLSSTRPKEVPEPTVCINGVKLEVTSQCPNRTTSTLNGCQVRLVLPEEMENYHTNGVVHPEETEEDMIPRRDLTSTTPTWTVTWITEVKLILIVHKTRGTCVKEALNKNEDSSMNGKGMDVSHHEVSCRQLNTKNTNGRTRRAKCESRPTCKHRK
mmetsp:Transcript_60415/g.112182  ORF Transcript_60415/g.112182 Transcript_60415/m.112182 type:complete len:203 (-) Transcript_60415:1232-1840(-)